MKEKLTGSRHRATVRQFTRHNFSLGYRNGSGGSDVRSWEAMQRETLTHLLARCNAISLRRRRNTHVQRGLPLLRRRCMPSSHLAAAAHTGPLSATECYQDAGRDMTGMCSEQRCWPFGVESVTVRAIGHELTGRGVVRTGSQFGVKVCQCVARTRRPARRKERRGGDASPAPRSVLRRRCPHGASEHAQARTSCAVEQPTVSASCPTAFVRKSLPLSAVPIFLMPTRRSRVQSCTASWRNATCFKRVLGPAL